MNRKKKKKKKKRKKHEQTFIRTNIYQFKFNE